MNKDNEISEIQKLFGLYRKGNLQENLIKQLSEIKLMTTKGTLLPESKCYLYDFYNPRLKIQKILKEIFLLAKNIAITFIKKMNGSDFLKFFELTSELNR